MLKLLRISRISRSGRFFMSFSQREVLLVNNAGVGFADVYFICMEILKIQLLERLFYQWH